VTPSILILGVSIRLDAPTLIIYSMLIILLKVVSILISIMSLYINNNWYYYLLRLENCKQPTRFIVCRYLKPSWLCISFIFFQIRMGNKQTVISDEDLHDYQVDLVESRKHKNNCFSIGINLFNSSRNFAVRN
jgi:hypothetical protein